MAVLDVFLVAGRVAQDGVLVAVHVGVEADEAFAVIDVKRLRLRTAVWRAVGDGQVLHRAIVGRDEAKGRSGGTGWIDVIVVRVSHNGLLAALADDRNIILRIDSNDFRERAKAQIDRSGRGIVGRDGIDCPLHGQEIPAAIGGHEQVR